MYPVRINFEEASEAWRNNKIYLGDGQFKYKCLTLTKKGEVCKNKPIKNSNYCIVHSKKKKV